MDMDGFNAEMEAKRERDRAGHQVTGSMEIVTAYENLGAGNTAFDGYYQTSIESRILGILRDGEAVGQATRGQQVEIVLAETCFYAEGGGQVGDRGVIIGPNGRVSVEDTQSPVAGLIVHRGKVAEGDIALGDAVTGQVESERRLDASRNHSGTHLLHAALRSVLGPHVRQAGSLCDTGRLRFDFNHVGAMTPNEQLSVQSLANSKIRENLAVTARETTYTDAVRDGALAFFGDRYGDVVRVVRMAGSDSNGHDHDDPFSFGVPAPAHRASDQDDPAGPFTLSQVSVDEHYGDEEAVVMALAEIVREEVRDLFAAGADFVQLDEPWMQARPEKARKYAIRAIDHALGDAAGPTIVHLCFGYAYAVKEKPSGYSFLPELEACAADQISIEAAQPKLDLSIVQHLPSKQIMVGVIDLADPVAETADTVAGRLRLALEVLRPSASSPRRTAG